MSDQQPKRRRWTILGAAVVVLNTVVATAVIAGHTFNDVPNSNIFHSDIEWLANNDVTRGCNPPANTSFCPTDNVTRQQMAAFMRRLAGAFGTAGDQSLDQVDLSSSGLVELLAINVTPKDASELVLSGDVSIRYQGGPTVDTSLSIRRGGCSANSPIVASGHWRLSSDDIGNVSITGIDAVSSATTYSLCFDFEAEGGGAVAAFHSLSQGMTAVWVPAA